MSTGQREELRIALVMNGGVSLAVWMGGVTTEIFRVVTRQHPVYAMLCDLTRTSASVDVVSGTSAGGVNGAALAVALIYGGDVARLRDVWLDSGALGVLLRPALGDNPGSLLRGDDYFLPQLQQAFAAMAPSPTPALTPGQMPIDLKLTTTLLSGRQGRTVDDFGVAVNDVDYRAHFHFRHLGAPSDFDDRDSVLPRLARAARSTASFPFAFEPSLVSADDGGAHLKDWQGHALQTPRYVVDGGILDNKPFRGAREAIFGMPRRGPVRRVLAYVNPDPGNGPPRKAEDLGKVVPSLGQVVSESILGIPQSQTIDDQLRAIEEHNKEVKARRDSVLTIVQSFEGVDLRFLAAKLFPVYRQRRLATTFQVFVVDELFKAAERQPRLKGGLLAVGKRGREQLQKVFVDQAWQGWIPAQWPKERDDPANRESASWQWGLFPVEFAASTTLELLRLTQHLLDYAEGLPDPPAAPAAAATAAPTPAADWSDPGTAAPAAAAGATAKVVDWLRRRGSAFGSAAPAPAPAPVEWARELRARRRSDDDATDRLQRRLGDFWRDAYVVVDEIEAIRAGERPTWDANAELLLAALARNAALPAGGADAARDAAELDAMFAFLARPERRRQCAGLVYRIVRLAREASDLAAAVALHAQRSGRLPEHEKHLADKLAKLAALLKDADETSSLQRLLAIEVIEYAFNEHDSLRNDVAIDLMQISGNASSPLGGRQDARDKLLGLQLGHFGAFYKRSWRANDWTYGRLDGAERLVRLLLNPDRLYRLFWSRKAEALAQIESIAVTSVESQVLRDTLAARWREQADAIESELAFLDLRGPRLPDTLPRCTDAVVARLHYGILREELPVLEDAIRRDQDEGAGGTSGDGQAFLDGLRGPLVHERAAAAPFSPEQAVARLQAGLIAGETLVGQAGSDLFTRTLAHTAAAMQGALASENARLGPVNLFFASLKLPLLGFYFVANGLTQQSRTSAAINGGLLVLGAALVLLQFMWSPKELAVAGVPSIVVTIGWGALAYGLLMSVARRPWLTGVFIAVALAVAMVFTRDYRVGVGLAGLVAVLLVLSYWFVWLQWVAGFLTLALVALWGSGWLWQQGADGVNVKVLAFAGVVALALLLAMWQAATLRRTRRP